MILLMTEGFSVLHQPILCNFCMLGFCDGSLSVLLPTLYSVWALPCILEGLEQEGIMCLTLAVTACHLSVIGNILSSGRYSYPLLSEKCFLFIPPDRVGHNWVTELTHMHPSKAVSWLWGWRGDFTPHSLASSSWLTYKKAVGSEQSFLPLVSLREALWDFLP